MTGAVDMGGKDAYAVLGIEDGLLATEADIRKTYRKLALKWHPDKYKGSDAERAAKEFDGIQNAYEVLTDDKAKEALDNLLRLRRDRELRYRRENERRLELVRELEEKERGSRRVRDEEERAAQQLERELARLRERLARQQGTSSASTSAPTHPGAGSGNPSGRRELLSEEEKRRALKVTWRKGAGRDYAVADLKEIFGNFGSRVQDVVVRDKGTKVAAIVVLGDASACARAVGSVCGDRDNPLLVVPLAKEGKPAPVAAKEPKRAAAAGANFENDVLAKLRASAAQKRKREGGERAQDADPQKRRQQAA